MANVVRMRATEVGLGQTVDAFLLEQDLAESTRRTYLKTFTPLLAELGPDTTLSRLAAEQLEEFVRRRWSTAAPATWNRNLATLRSLVAFLDAARLGGRRPASPRAEGGAP